MKQDPKKLKGKFFKSSLLEFEVEGDENLGFVFNFPDSVWAYIDEIFSNLDKENRDLLAGDIYWQTRYFYKGMQRRSEARASGKPYEKLERLFNSITELMNNLWAVQSDPTARHALEEAEEGYRLFLLIRDHRETAEFEIHERRWKEKEEGFDEWIFDGDQLEVEQYLSQRNKDDGIDDCYHLQEIWECSETIQPDELYHTLEESFKRLNDDQKIDTFSQLKWEKLPPIDSPIYDLDPDGPWQDVARRKVFIHEVMNRYKPRRGNQVDHHTRFFIQRIASFIRRDCGDTFKISHAENSRFTQLIDALFSAVGEELSLEGVSARIKAAIKDKGK